MWKGGHYLFLLFGFLSALSVLVMVIGLTGVQFGLIIQVINKIGRYTFRRSWKGQKAGERHKLLYDVKILFEILVLKTSLSLLW